MKERMKERKNGQLHKKKAAKFYLVNVHHQPHYLHFETTPLYKTPHFLLMDVFFLKKKSEKKNKKYLVEEKLEYYFICFHY